MSVVDYDMLKIELSNKYQKEIDKDNSLKNFEYYTSLFSNEEIDLEQNTVLYDSFLGKSMTDNPYAMFLEIKKRDTDNLITHVWVLKPEVSEQIKRFWSMENIVFVNPYSLQHIEYLVKAKYIITNVSMPYYYQKKSGQVLMNTWHGTPIKGMGKYMGGQYGQWDNVMRSFLMSDYIISPNRYTTETISNSYDLNDIYEGEILEIGYPRVDLINQTKKQLMIDFLTQNNIDIDSEKKVLLYAPTWRGQDANRKDMTAEFNKNVKLIQQYLPSGWQLLVKAHQIVYDQVSKDDNFKGILIPNSIDTSELLSIVDGLITDYSSIFFDYYVTGKPIVLWAYDLVEYQSERGLLINLDELAGQLATTEQDLFTALQNLENIIIDPQLTKQFINYQDNQSTKVAVDILFGETVKYRDKIKTIHSNKKNKIVYVDGLEEIDAQEKINYINLQNFDMYNIIVLAKSKPNKEVANMLMAISPKAKQLFRVGRTAVTKDEYADFVIANQYELTIDNITHVKKVFKREFKRSIPISNIDTIDYLGNQDAYFLNLLGLSNSANRFIFKSTNFMRDRKNAARIDYNEFIEPILSQYNKLELPNTVISETEIDDVIYKIIPISKSENMLINTSEENIFLETNNMVMNVLNFGKIKQEKNVQTNVFLVTDNMNNLSKLKSTLPNVNIINLNKYSKFQKYLLQVVDRVITL